MWSFYDITKLPNTVLNLYDQAEAAYISAASIWEIAIKVRLGKLRGNPEELCETLDKGGFLELPVSAKHAAVVAKLPLHHSDLFHRILVAQAQIESLFLITTDAHLPQYSDLVIRV